MMYVHLPSTVFPIARESSTTMLETGLSTSFVHWHDIFFKNMFKKKENTSALLQQELHAPLVFLLLLREPSVSVELRAVQGVFQPLHQLLLLVQLHLQLGQGELQLAFLLAQRHHLRSPRDISITLLRLHISVTRQHGQM